MAERMKKIKTGAFSRGFALAKLSATVGAKAASHAVGGLFASEETNAERFKSLLFSQVSLLTKELGQLKGSVMKVGQMLSLFGEHFLPPEVNELLKSLQSQSPPLEWAAIEKVLKRQLSKEILAELEIDPNPLAAASLGQVHRARRKSDGASLVMKVQYPGVDAAIEGDLKTLRSILTMTKVVPKGPKYDELFNEVRMMLHQEVDYRKELTATDEFREKLAPHSRYRVPQTFPEYSNSRVLTTSYEEGFHVGSPAVQALSQDRRNEIAVLAMQLYFRELFEFRMMQTDPHFGNYLNRLVLLDFGAVRKLPKTFMDPYIDMARGALAYDRPLLTDAAIRLGFLQEGDSDEIKNPFFDICDLIVEPFKEAGYAWEKSDLPKRVAMKATQLAVAFRLRPPPREVVFIDRKISGIFFFLSVLKARIDARALIEPFVNERY
jgi:predicted unusual protein kinase regulating ubiquinone biosynthesis (AarF/ABC1/UbiB family)